MMSLRCHSAKVRNTAVDNSMVAMVTDLWHYLSVCHGPLEFLMRCYLKFIQRSGLSGGVMALGNVQVPGRTTNLDSKARACCACRRCEWVLFGHFFVICHFCLLSPSLWESTRYRLKYCFKWPLRPKQPIIQ